MDEFEIQFASMEEEENVYLEIGYKDFLCIVANRKGKLFLVIYEVNVVHTIPLLPFLDDLSRAKDALSKIKYGDFLCEVVNRQENFFLLIYEGNEVHTIPFLPFFEALNYGKQELENLN